MTKTIELTGDWDIPEGYTNKAELKKVSDGDYILRDCKLLKVAHPYFAEEFCLIPERKVIDWQKIIDSKVLCEFSNFNDFSKSYFGYLVSEGSFFEMQTNLDHEGEFKYCRPAQGILFGHDGGECPLPAGLVVKAIIYSYEAGYGLHDDGGWRHSTITNHSENIDWERVVSYKIIGLS